MAAGGNHDWDGFHQLSDLVDHQRGGLRDLTLRAWLLRHSRILVVLLQGGDRLAGCLDRLAGGGELAAQIPFPQLGGDLDHPCDHRLCGRAHRRRGFGQNGARARERAGIDDLTKRR